MNQKKQGGPCFLFVHLVKLNNLTKIMKTNQKGFTSATMTLLGFTIIVGIWFLWTHSFADIRNGVKDLSFPGGNGERISKTAASKTIDQTP